MNLPKELRDEKDADKQEGIWIRENKFKNVVIRRIIEIRNEKKKPKLKDLLAMFNDRHDEKSK